MIGDTFCRMRKFGPVRSCVLAVAFGTASIVHGDPPPAPPRIQLPSAPVSSVFYLAKSENKNQVHYAVRVDDRCRPVGAAPVYGYWRDLEVGPSATSRLLQHEQPAYGLT